MEARGYAEDDVVAESVVLLEREGVEVDDAQVALRIGLVLDRRPDARVAHGNPHGSEVGDRPGIGPREVGAVHILVDAHAEGEVVLDGPAERPPYFEERLVLARPPFEGEALSGRGVVEGVEL